MSIYKEHLIQSYLHFLCDEKNDISYIHFVLLAEEYNSGF